MHSLVVFMPSCFISTVYQLFWCSSPGHSHSKVYLVPIQKNAHFSLNCWVGMHVCMNECMIYVYIIPMNISFRSQIFLFFFPIYINCSSVKKLRYTFKSKPLFQNCIWKLPKLFPFLFLPPPVLLVQLSLSIR